MSLSSQKCRALCQEEHVSVSYQTESLFQLHGKVKYHVSLMRKRLLLLVFLFTKAAQWSIAELT